MPLKKECASLPFGRSNSAPSIGPWLMRWKFKSPCLALKVLPSLLLGPETESWVSMSARPTVKPLNDPVNVRGLVICLHVVRGGGTRNDAMRKTAIAAALPLVHERRALGRHNEIGAGARHDGGLSGVVGQRQELTPGFYARCFMNSSAQPELVFEQQGELGTVHHPDHLAHLMKKAGL